MSGAVPSKSACGACEALRVYGCPCQLPTCRRRTYPEGPGCLKNGPTSERPSEERETERAQ